MIVVSEIGEIWSPHTEPAKIDAIEITNIGSPSLNTEVTIGIKTANVPQDVPVENDKPIASTKITAGMINSGKLAFLIKVDTKAPAFNLTDTISPKVHANTRIIIAETINLKPCGIQAVNSS